VKTFNELVTFLTKTMRMSHVYQPLLIRSLVDAGGSATLHQLAQSFLVQDESQLLYYEKRIKEMPLKVLSRHGVVSKNGELVSLNIKKLTLEEKAQVREICEQKLQEYVRKRGISIWDYRLMELDPVSDSLRFQVLKDSNGRCALCGISAKERPLDVDHIIPRSRGGNNELSNLQALCSKCNRSKGNKDDTDFRADRSPERVEGCLFCADEATHSAVAGNESVYAIEDQYPVTPGHHLIIPRRHTEDYFSMSTNERQQADELLRMLKNKIMQDDANVSGFNVGMNCGVTAGQTVMHAHIHLIPRRDGDVHQPQGGVRGCVPTKMSY